MEVSQAISSHPLFIGFSRKYHLVLKIAIVTVSFTHKKWWFSIIVLVYNPAIGLPPFLASLGSPCVACGCCGHSPRRHHPGWDRTCAGPTNTRALTATFRSCRRKYRVYAFPNTVWDSRSHKNNWKRIDQYMNGILLFHLFWEIWGITAKDGD